MPRSGKTLFNRKQMGSASLQKMEPAGAELKPTLTITKMEGLGRVDPKPDCFWGTTRQGGTSHDEESKLLHRQQIERVLPKTKLRK